MEQIQLSRFQENLQAVIAAVKHSDRPVLITDKGRSLVKIVPVSNQDGSWLGCMQGTGRILGDIVSPTETEDAWEALAA